MTTYDSADREERGGGGLGGRGGGGRRGGGKRGGGGEESQKPALRNGTPTNNDNPLDTLNEIWNLVRKNLLHTPHRKPTMGGVSKIGKTGKVHVCTCIIHAQVLLRWWLSKTDWTTPIPAGRALKKSAEGISRDSFSEL